MLPPPHTQNLSNHRLSNPCLSLGGRVVFGDQVSAGYCCARFIKLTVFQCRCSNGNVPIVWGSTTFNHHLYLGLFTRGQPLDGQVRALSSIATTVNFDRRNSQWGEFISDIRPVCSPSTLVRRASPSGGCFCSVLWSVRRWHWSCAVRLRYDDAHPGGWRSNTRGHPPIDTTHQLAFHLLGVLLA